MALCAPCISFPIDVFKMRIFEYIAKENLSYKRNIEEILLNFDFPMRTCTTSFTKEFPSKRNIEFLGYHSFFFVNLKSKWMILIAVFLGA